VVRIDAPCLDCGSAILLEMKDGEVSNADPQGLVAYTSVIFKNWFADIPYS
jgi:hypothetical protein